MKRITCNVLSTLIMLITCTQLFAQPSNQNSNAINLQTADSLFFSQKYQEAYSMYKKILGDTSQNSVAWNRLAFSGYNIGDYENALKGYAKALSHNPSAPLKASVYSRMAMVYSVKKENQKAITAIDSAFNSGYVNLKEMDSLKAFNNIRNNAAFTAIRNKIYNALYPCMSNTHAREFDFWAGEWNVYVTGTTQLAGHSLVQIISGGCALLENWDSQLSTGKSINFIDPNTGKWKQSWAGSYPNGIQEFTNGEYKDSAMHFDFESKDAQGNKTIGRFIFYNLGPDKVRQFSESSTDDGKTWTTNYDFTYIRKQ